jgi:hypothetical protein
MLQPLDVVAACGKGSAGMVREGCEIRMAGRLGSGWADGFGGLENRDEPDKGACAGRPTGYLKEGGTW